MDRAQTTLSGGLAPQGLGFKATVIWAYYNDLSGAMAFYENNFGLDMIVDQGWTKIYQTSPTGFLGLVDQEHGMHRSTEQKGVNCDRIRSDGTTAFTPSWDTTWRGITWSSTAFSSMRTTQDSSS